MLPGADCFVFDHRVVRWNFQRGDGTNPRHYTFSLDPRTIRDVVAAFELAWNRQPRMPTTSLTETRRLHLNARRLRARRHGVPCPQTGLGPAPAARKCCREVALA